MTDLLRDALLGRRTLPDPALAARAHRLATVVQALLAVYGVTLLAGLVAGAVFSYAGEVPMMIAGGVVFAATAVAFAWWTWTMYRLVPALEGAETEHATWWAWAGYLIPIANLFRPYQVVREIREATDPEALDPAAVRPGATVPVGMWWGLWLAAGFSERILRQIPEPGPSEVAVGYTVAALGSVALWVGATVSAFLVVRQIDGGMREVETILADAAGRADGAPEAVPVLG